MGRIGGRRPRLQVGGKGDDVRFRAAVIDRVEVAVRSGGQAGGEGLQQDGRDRDGGRAGNDREVGVRIVRSQIGHIDVPVHGVHSEVFGEIAGRDAANERVVAWVEDADVVGPEIRGVDVATYRVVSCPL